MIKNHFLISIIAFIVIVSFWSCSSPAGPDSSGSAYAEITVWSKPWHAFIWMDGKDTGYRTNAMLKIEVGTHTVLLLKPGYKDWEKTFTATEENVGPNAIRINAHLIGVSITVKEPTSNTVWNKGQEAVISWEPVHEPPGNANNDNETDFLTSSGGESKSQNVMRPLYLPNVKIYLYKGDTEVMTIVSEIENTGSYTWTVDPSLEDGTDYKVRVTSSWETPNISPIYGESEPFTIQ